MLPEQKARVNIDRQLDQAGWLVQDAIAANIRAALRIALLEFPLKKGFIPNHKRAATDRASRIEAQPTREAKTDLVISERR